MGTQDMKKMKFAKDILEDPNFQINQEEPVYLAVRAGLEELEPAEMMKGGLLVVTDQPPTPPVKEISTKTVGARLKELEANLNLSGEWINRLGDKVEGLEEQLKASSLEIKRQSKLHDRFAETIGMTIFSLETKLDNQTITSTDAINGLVEQANLITANLGSVIAMTGLDQDELARLVKVVQANQKGK
jgi:hypothetical protein